MWKAIVLFLAVAGVVLGVYTNSPKKISVRAVDNFGALEERGGIKVELSRIKMPSVGDENYENAMFLMTEMTKDAGLWVKRDGEGYLVWVGCREMLGVADCRKGLLINEVLVKAGVVTEN